MDEFLDARELIFYFVVSGGYPPIKQEKELKEKFAKVLTFIKASGEDQTERRERSVLPDGTKHGKNIFFYWGGSVRKITTYEDGKKVNTEVFPLFHIPLLEKGLFIPLTFHFNSSYDHIIQDEAMAFRDRKISIKFSLPEDPYIYQR